MSAEDLALHRRIADLMRRGRATSTDYMIFLILNGRLEEEKAAAATGGAA